MLLKPVTKIAACLDRRCYVMFAVKPPVLVPRLSAAKSETDAMNDLVIHNRKHLATLDSCVIFYG